MAVELTRTGWLQLFIQMRLASMFLSRMFTIKPGGIYNGGKVAIDIQRFGEDVAIAIKKCTGPNLNDFDIFTTKEFTPPAYGEAFPMDVCDLVERMTGVDPYTAAYTEYAAQMVKHMSTGFVLVDNKIKRAVELQASQILQTGTLTLTDADGATVYELDFKPKATHFPNAAAIWSGASDKLGDLQSLADVISADGQAQAKRCIFGATALRLFLADTDVIAALDNRRMELGEVAPEFAGAGAVFYGHVWVGTYKLEIWAYAATFKHPQTGGITKYIDDDKVVMIGDGVRLDMTSARVPLPLGPDPRVASLVPGRMSSREEGFDVTPNVYCTPDGEQVMGSLRSRPLLIPVQIDGFGCLDTIF